MIILDTLCDCYWTNELQVIYVYIIQMGKAGKGYTSSGTEQNIIISIFDKMY